MKEKVSAATQNFARSMVQPIMFMSVSGLLIAIAALLKMDYMPTAVQTIGKFIYTVNMNGMLNQLSVIFCVGLTVTMAKTKKADAAICGLLSFLMFLNANNWYLKISGQLLENATSGSGQTTVLGIQVIDMGVFLGIMLGCITAWIFNKLCNVKFPDVVSVYGGSRLAFLVTMVVDSVLAIVLCYVWPVVNAGISSLTGLISNAGAFGVFIYGFLNRFLIPVGLHHLIYMPFIFTPIGGTATIAGETASGAAMIWSAQLGELANLTALNDAARFMGYGFSKMFGCVGICLAFIKTAKKEKKDTVKSMLLPALLVALVAGITEPFEFVFLFSAPLLWLVHSVLDGVFQMISYMIGCRLYATGGWLTFITNNAVISPELTHIFRYLILGVVGSVVWYFVFVFLIKKLNLKTPGREDTDEINFGKYKNKAEAKAAAEKEKLIASGKIGKNGIGDVTYLIDGLGGPGNIEEVNNCFTRLRCVVKDVNQVQDDIIKKFPNKGIVKKGNTVQVIIGMQVQNVREEVAQKLGMD